MNKKILVFSFVGLFMLALVSAAVVNYLSNTSELGIEVKSPFTIGFYDGESVVDSLELESVVGGDTFSFETRIESLTSVDTPVNIEYVISNDLNDVTLADFGNINVDVRSDGMGEYHFFDGTFADFCTYSPVGGHGANSCTIEDGDLVLTIPNWFWSKEKAEIFADLQFALNVEPTNYNFDATIKV